VQTEEEMLSDRARFSLINSVMETLLRRMEELNF
jgi:hypothetical protein